MDFIPGTMYFIIQTYFIICVLYKQYIRQLNPNFECNMIDTYPISEFNMFLFERITQHMPYSHSSSDLTLIFNI